MTLLSVFLMSGCGSGGSSPPLNDQEFAASARVVCTTLNADIAKLQAVISFTAKAGEYQTAAASLDKLNISESSAPNGMRLRSAIKALADSYGALGSALDQALAKAGLPATATIVITADGKFFAYGTSVFDITPLNLDPSLLTNVKAAQVQLQEAAQALSLSECAIRDAIAPQASGR